MFVPHLLSIRVKLFSLFVSRIQMSVLCLLGLLTFIQIDCWAKIAFIHYPPNSRSHAMFNVHTHDIAPPINYSLHIYVKRDALIGKPNTIRSFASFNYSTSIFYPIFRLFVTKFIVH